MTISSALNAAVMGLQVNATRLATISDNIANSATIGYKRSDVDFSSMVINQRASIYSAGGVRATAYKEISSEGALIGTGNSTDISINGRGLIPVTDQSGVNETAQERALMLLPTGSFAADQNGYLKTLSGLTLLGWPADASGNVSEVSRDSGAGLVPVNISVSQFTASPTTDISLGVNLPANASVAGESGDPFTLPVEYYDNLGRPQTISFKFTPDVSGGGVTDTWEIEIFDRASATPDVAVGTLSLKFNDTPENGGSIESVTPGAGITYDAVTGEITFAAENGPMAVFVGKPNDVAGLTQLAAPFSPYNVTKTGAPIGDLKSVEIDDKGFLEAVYDSGFRRVLFQIPIADVPNLNGLTAQNNQAFTVSKDSGDIYFWDSGSGPIGTLTSYALMESNTDVATELTNLIETQRAYSSNAKIVQTVDEMLQETTNLKR
ncbi:MAG: flagellar biosynthesis protein FlgE [Robiginitomaculum sp.]|nr:MAG: flagellar biosynthesis protein FlgE [Robiginitomaculum sp.]